MDDISVLKRKRESLETMIQAGGHFHEELDRINKEIKKYELNEEIQKLKTDTTQKES